MSAGQETIARFGGSGQTKIEAMASDRAGNLYVAGTTTAPDLPVKNAAQPESGEASILRSSDGGATWVRAGLPNTDVATVVADP